MSCFCCLYSYLFLDASFGVEFKIIINSDASWHTTTERNNLRRDKLLKSGFWWAQNQLEVEMFYIVVGCVRNGKSNVDLHLYRSISLFLSSALCVSLSLHRFQVLRVNGPQASFQNIHHIYQKV